jgi:menaquinone-dependent protoporphyrinogen IX oxidase
MIVLNLRDPFDERAILVYLKKIDMKGIIIYQGKYGATQQYASWLSEDLLIHAMNPDELPGEKLRLYDFVILAGSVYVGKWMLRDWLKKHAGILQNKKVFILIVCGTPSSKKAEQERLAKTNIPVSLIDNAETFFLAGRLDVNKLSWMDRFLLKMGARMAKDPETKEGMLKGYDGVSKDNLGEVSASIKKFEFSKYGSLRTRRHQLVEEKN